MSKKAQKEKAAIDAIVALDKQHKALINCPDADPVDLAALAVRYMHEGMRIRGGQIMREARELDRRIYVPKNVIIEETSGYGGTNETTLPVRLDNLAPAFSVRADC